MKKKTDDESYTNEKDILVVVAHPDDEVLGAGGTIAKLSKDNDMYLCILGKGIASRGGDNIDDRKEEMVKKAKKAAEIIGIKKVHFSDFPDQMYETVPLLEINKSIERIIDDLNPDMVLTHSNVDLNRDHRIVNESVLIATRPTKYQTVKKVITFEVPSSTEWNFNDSFRPNLFVDISEYQKTKFKALHIYDTEMREYPHPRSRESIIARTMYWGSCGHNRKSQ